MDTKIYVSTYHKYNNGTLNGEWIDISDFSDKDNFINECREIHKDENEPELMFQSVPDELRDFISESFVNEKLWEYLEFIEDIDDDIITYFEKTVDNLSTIDFDELVIPEKYDSDGDLVYKYLESVLQNTNKETIQLIYNITDNNATISYLTDMNYNVIRINGKIYSDYI